MRVRENSSMKKREDQGLNWKGNDEDSNNPYITNYKFIKPQPNKWRKWKKK
jgi:hypothetical protein